MVEQTRSRMTAAEFFELPETNLPMALIDGEVIMSPAPVPKHQSTSGDFYNFLRTNVPNGIVYYSPIDVALDEENVVQPDIVWVAENSRCVIGEKRLEGPPDLVVEVFSPGTVRLDKTTKFKLYERFAVYEYWMIDPIEQYVEVYHLQDTAYILQGVYGPEDTFESRILHKPVALQPIFGA